MHPVNSIHKHVDSAKTYIYIYVCVVFRNICIGLYFTGRDTLHPGSTRRVAVKSVFHLSSKQRCWFTSLCVYAMAWFDGKIMGALSVWFCVVPFKRIQRCEGKPTKWDKHNLLRIEQKNICVSITFFALHLVVA